MELFLKYFKSQIPKLQIPKQEKIITTSKIENVDPSGEFPQRSKVSNWSYQVNLDKNHEGALWKMVVTCL